MPPCPESDDDEMTFEEALLSEKLQGIPTYRMPFHPRYGLETITETLICKQHLANFSILPSLKPDTKLIVTSQP